MKKILLIALVALMLLSAISFVGCGKKAEEPKVEETETPESTTVVPDTAAVGGALEAEAPVKP